MKKTVNQIETIKTLRRKTADVGVKKEMRADQVAAAIRERIVEGYFRPGQHLSEPLLRAELCVSRNTLREVFRLLSKEGILVHRPNKGVFLAIPDLATIADVYRVRRLIECQAVLAASPSHPAIGQMRRAVELAQSMRETNEWGKVGNANILFHSAIAQFADSQRISAFFTHVLAEMRFIFSPFDDLQSLHAPFVDRNAAILQMIEKGESKTACKQLEAYLNEAECFVAAAYATHKKDKTNTKIVS